MSGLFNLCFTHNIDNIGAQGELSALRQVLRPAGSRPFADFFIRERSMTTAPGAGGEKPTTDTTLARGLTPAGKPGRADAPKAGADRDILDTAWTLGRFNTFTTAARSSGLETLLSGKGPFTVFAPTDRAFAKLSVRDRDALMADPDRLAKVLRHHVVEGKVKAPKNDEPRTATPMHGADLTITTAEGVYHVGGAKLVKTNDRASNGVIHAIDTVLMTR
jgi:uncharacterized surface protein with fasciclin (FAS1) repeats